MKNLSECIIIIIIIIIISVSLPAGRVQRVVRVEDRLVLDRPQRMRPRRPGLPGVLPSVSPARADADRPRAPVHVRQGPHGGVPRRPRLGVRQRAPQGPVQLQVAGRSTSLIGLIDVSMEGLLD